MNWSCPAIDHGVAIFPDGKIRPCCQASADYSKPLSEIGNPHRFADLKTPTPPDACKSCWHGKNTYRDFFNKKAQPGTGIQFLDFRHSNQCNLKCRYCSPHFSNQWAKELGYEITLNAVDINAWTGKLLTPDLQDIYFCGGEPLIMASHYRVLDQLIESGLSKQISLRYNSNCSVIEYKSKNIFDLWAEFKTVTMSVSIDSTGESLNYIRSGSDWEAISKNIQSLLDHKQALNNLTITFAPTVSLLNIWFLPELFDYAIARDIKVQLNILQGPDYLSLCALPNQELQQQARDNIDKIKPHISSAEYNQLIEMTHTQDNEYLFTHAVRHILLLDQCRGEKLFELLPFKKTALELTAKNNDYE